MSTPIHVNYGGLDDAANQMTQIAGRIDSELETLRSKLQRMTWEGSDREAYNTHQRNWDTAIRDLNTVLAQIGGTLSNIRQNYHDTETNNAKIW
jgi:WXG100 family type VII secretion target